MASQGVESLLALRHQLQEKKTLLRRQVDEERRRAARLTSDSIDSILYLCQVLCNQWLIPSCRLEQENTQVQAMLGAAKVENDRAKDKLAAVKAKLKAKEESMARAQDEENTTRNRINLSKAQAGMESDRRLKDVVMYQKEVMQLCNQMRKSNISGGNLDALEEKKAGLLKELEVIEQELHGFEQEGVPSPLVLEDWQGLVNRLEFVKTNFKSAEKKMKEKASATAKQMSDRQLAYSQPVYTKEN